MDGVNGMVQRDTISTSWFLTVMNEYSKDILTVVGWFDALTRFDRKSTISE